MRRAASLNRAEPNIVTAGPTWNRPLNPRMNSSLMRLSRVRPFSGVRV